MNLRSVILYVAAGVSICMWSGDPRAGEAAELSQKAEIWLGGQRVNRPAERRVTPLPEPLMEEDDAALGTATAGEEGEDAVALEGPRSSDAVRDPAVAQVGDAPVASYTDSPIATALDECLRQSRAALLEPPRPLREPSRTGNTHEQVSYVTPRVQPSASSSSAQGDKASTAGEPPARKAASVSPPPVRLGPRWDAASTGRTAFSQNWPQVQPRSGAAGAVPAPDTAGANQPPQSNLAEILTLLGIATLVFLVLRRWGAGKAHREPTTVS